MTHVQIIDSWSLSQTSRVLASWILAFLALPFSSITKTEGEKVTIDWILCHFFLLISCLVFPQRKTVAKFKIQAETFSKPHQQSGHDEGFRGAFHHQQTFQAPEKKDLLIVSGSLLLRFALVTWLTLPYEFMILTFRLCHCWLRFWKDLMRGARPNLQDESSRSKRSVWKSGEISVHVSQGTIRDHSGIEHKSIVL